MNIHENRVCAYSSCNKQGLSTGKNNVRKRDGLIPRAKYCDHHRKVVGNFTNFKYVKFKKSYCENIDGRLGYKCTSTIVDSCQLQVDHKDGNHKNNNKDNCQTLCSNCHDYKTYINKDNLNRYIYENRN